MPVAIAVRGLIGRSAAIQQVRTQIESLAHTPVPILIVGETGTGKELCAQAIGHLSGRTPFVAVNCAAFPESLAESELFGHERGAFTGAVRSHVGVVALANGGTLFLDELNELSSAMQAKLLRALESGEYRPIGSTRTLRSDFRILAATSGRIDEVVASGRLRVELVHRLGAVRIVLPPLRDRLEDIPEIAVEFLRSYRARAGRGPLRMAKEACAVLMQENWPGNIRQLRNVVEGAAAMAGADETVRLAHVLQITVPHLYATAEVVDIPSLAVARKRAELRAILDALGRVDGNRERAAKLLRISQATLYRKLGGPPQSA